MNISIVVCTRNRPDRLADALESCLRQTVKPFEVIVVDDGDLDDGWIDNWREKIQKENIFFHYHHKPPDRRGLTISRNVGWQMAKGEIVQYLDDDAELDETCLARLSKVFALDTGGRLSGVDFPILEQARRNAGRRLIDRCYQLAGLWKLGSRSRVSGKIPKNLAGSDRLVRMDFLQGGSMAIPRAVLERIGGFDENLTGSAMGEDKEISFRLAKVGVLVRILSAGVVHHSDPDGRNHPRQIGFETSFNYLYINCKNVAFGIGEIFLLAYNLGMLLATECLFALVGERKYHLEQIKGITAGILVFSGRLWRSRRA